MTANVYLAQQPIYQFFNNAGQPNAGGSLLTQVGGVNFPTYQDPAGNIPLPNPIPLNSRGEISNTSGISCQLFLSAGVAYAFTLFDVNGNQLWTAGSITSLAPVAVGNMTDEKGSGGSVGFVSGVDFTAGTTAALTLSQNYGSASNLWVAFDGVEQGGDTYTLNGNVLTFSAPIPVGTQKVYVKGGTALSISSPAIGSVTDSSVATGSKLYGRINNTMFVTDFGALGNGVADDTIAINNAFAAAYAAGRMLFFPKGTYMVREFSPGIGYAILNPGVSFYGEGMTHSTIMPLPTMPNSANFMEIVPSGGAYLDFMFIEGMFFQPTNGVTKYGASAMYWNFQTSSNASGVKIERVYCAPGNAYSMIWNNAPAINLQGIPAEMVVEDCAFWEGVQMIGGGDSNRFRDVTFRSSAGSQRVGLQYNAVGSSGNAPSCLTVEESNFDCDGGAVVVFGSYKTSIRHNNIEQSHGAASGSGSVVDIDGSEISNSFAEVIDNVVSLFGTTTASSAIRVNVAEGTIVENNRLLAGITIAEGIFVTANANDTVIGLNEIAASYTTPILNMGTGTRGFRIPLTLLNGFSNTGGGFATANVIKNKEGRVSLEGTLSNAGAASGTVICTLPSPYWPPLGHTFIAFGVVGGVISPLKIVVDTSGNLTMSSTGTVTQLSLDGLAFDTTSYIQSAA